MAINLYSPLWKESFKYLGWILLFVFLFFRGCSSTEKNSPTVKVIVPEVKGDFEPKKPYHEPVLIKANSPQLKNRTRKEILQVENPINKKLIAENEKLKADFEKATTVEKPLLFDKAIQLNKFSTKFEDDNLILNINGIVQGEVKEITPNYIVKEKKIEIPVKQKETVFRLLGGVGLGTNKVLNQFMYKLDLGFQNKKGDIISAEYINIENNNFGMVSYKKSIFNIKR